MRHQTKAKQTSGVVYAIDVPFSIVTVQLFSNKCLRAFLLLFLTLNTFRIILFRKAITLLIELFCKTFSSKSFQENKRISK